MQRKLVLSQARNSFSRFSSNECWQTRLLWKTTQYPCSYRSSILCPHCMLASIWQGVNIILRKPKLDPIVYGRKQSLTNLISYYRKSCSEWVIIIWSETKMAWTRLQSNVQYSISAALYMFLFRDKWSIRTVAQITDVSGSVVRRGLVMNSCVPSTARPPKPQEVFAYHSQRGAAAHGPGTYTLQWPATSTHVAGVFPSNTYYFRLVKQASSFPITTILYMFLSCQRVTDL